MASNFIENSLTSAHSSADDLPLTFPLQQHTKNIRTLSTNNKIPIELKDYFDDITGLSNHVYGKFPILVGISGGRCCGKYSMCEKIMKDIGKEMEESVDVLIISQRDFYKEFEKDELIRKLGLGEFNWDALDAFDWELLDSILLKIISGDFPVNIPKYDHHTFERIPGSLLLTKPKLLILSGPHLLHRSQTRHLLDIKIFLDVDGDIRLSNQVLKDSSLAKSHEGMGVDLDSILVGFVQNVKPVFEDCILPSKRYADLIIPGGGENRAAISMISSHLIEMMNSYTM